MAEWENRLGQDSPLARALRLAMPENMRNPLLHPESVNHFALPPKQPTAELRNPAPRPGDYLSPVSEALSPTMGAYGLGNALGDAYVKGREGDYKGMASPLAEILLSMAPVPGMKKGAMPPRVENPIKAYHGSPHDFDRFDLGKIGTGEGAQAYGHGLYFAENEGVAKSYRDALAPALTVDGKIVRHGPNAADAAELAAQKVGAPAEVQDRLRWYINRGYSADKALADVSASFPEWHAKISEVLQPAKDTGKMYEVAIHASPDQFLDWDKPLSQQSEAVRKAMAGLGVATDDVGKWSVRQTQGGNWSVINQWGERVKTLPSQEAANALAAEGTAKNNAGNAQLAYTRLGGNAVYSGLDKGVASAKLNEAGIPGIRYLDQGSRGAGNGTSNFVVFDPALIEILRKYGLLGPVAAGATANALMGEKSEQ